MEPCEKQVAIQRVGRVPETDTDVGSVSLTKTRGLHCFAPGRSIQREHWDVENQSNEVNGKEQLFLL